MLPTTNTSNNVATVPQGTQVVANGTNPNQAGYGMNPYPSQSAPDTSAKTTPIIGASQAIDHYLTTKNATDDIVKGIATQAQNNAQIQANKQANTQTTQPNQNQPTEGNNAIQTGGNANNNVATQTDNTDLTTSLDNATKALNAANGITAPDKETYNQTETNLTKQQTDIQDKLDKINTQISNSSDQYQATVAQIQQGTFPLTPVQQSLLDQTKSAVSQLNQSAQQTAQLYAEAGKTFGAVHGLSQFNPGAAQQAISAAMAKGKAEIAKAEMDGVKQLADLQKGFADDDFNMITKSYDALQTSLNAKEKILNDLSTKVQKMSDDATKQYQEDYKNYLTETQNAISNAFKSVSLTDTEKKNLFDEAMRSSEFTEKQKQDATDNYYKGITASQNAEKIKIEQQNANTNLLKLQLDQSDASKAASNAIVQTLSGKTWVNGTGLDAKGESAALDAGQKVLKGDNAKAMLEIGNIQQSLNGLIKSFQDANIFDKNGNPTGQGITSGFWKNWQLGNSAGTAGNVGTNLKNLIPELQKLPDTADLVTVLEDNQINKGGSQQDVHNKITNITHALDESENTILSNASIPQEGATGIINGQSAIFKNGNWETQ